LIFLLFILIIFIILLTKLDEFKFQNEIDEIKNDYNGIPDKNLYDALKEISGKDKLYVNDFSEITELNLVNKHILDISGLAKFNLSSVEVLYLDNNELKSVEKINTKNLSNLKKISLSSNNIKSINKNTFRELENLEVLSLNDNVEIQVDKNSFKYLKKLSTLSLAENEFKGIKLKNILNIKELDLSGNKFRSLLDINISELTTIEKLYLRNSIHFNVDKNLFNGLHNLKAIDFSESSLRNIEDYAFSNLKNLEYINMNNCKIEEIDYNAFYGLENLCELYLMGNYLDKLSLAPVLNLKKLDLSSNYIKNIDNVDFSSFSNLEELYLVRNNISEISSEKFVNMNKLKVLILSKNLIEFLPSELFRGLGNLEILYLDNNKIFDLEEKTFYSLNKLKSLSLGFNSIDKIDENSFESLYNLEYLDVRHNNLKELPSLKNNIKLKLVEMTDYFYMATDFSDNYLTKETIIKSLPEKLLLEQKWLNNQVSSQWIDNQIESQRADMGANYINVFKQIISIENYNRYSINDYDELLKSFKGYFTDRGLKILFYNNLVGYNYNHIFKYKIKAYENLNIELISEYIYKGVEYKDLKVSYTYMDNDNHKYELVDYYSINIEDRYIDYITLDVSRSSVAANINNTFMDDLYGLGEWIYIINDQAELEVLQQKVINEEVTSMINPIDALYSYVIKLQNINVQYNKYEIIIDNESEKVYQYEFKENKDDYKYFQVKVIQPLINGKKGIWLAYEFRFLKAN